MIASQKGHTQKFALPPLVYNRRACITAWKLLASCIAEKMSLLALGPVILGKIKGLISYLRSKNLVYLPNTWTSHMESLTILGCVEYLQQSICQGDLIGRSPMTYLGSIVKKGTDDFFLQLKFPSHSPTLLIKTPIVLNKKKIPYSR